MVRDTCGRLSWYLRWSSSFATIAGFHALPTLVVRRRLRDNRDWTGICWKPETENAAERCSRVQACRDRSDGIICSQTVALKTLAFFRLRLRLRQLWFVMNANAALLVTIASWVVSSLSFWPVIKLIYVWKTVFWRLQGGLFSFHGVCI